MMTLRQTIQAAPTKTNELFAKLANTSNQAVKTREGLLVELQDELTRYVEVEEGHFLPALRKIPETKDLAVAALKESKDLRAQLVQLETTPKDSDEFLGKVAELQKGFQAHVRSGRNDMLPAMLKALSDEQATELADSIERAQAEVETARREAKREEAAEAKREAEAAEQAETSRRAAVRAEKAAERATREAVDDTADAFKRGAASVKDGADAVAAGVVHKAEQTASSVRQALGTYRGTAEDAAGDLRAVSTSSINAMKLASEAGSAWLGITRKLFGLNLDTSRRMLQCRSIGQVAELQRDYVSGSLRTLMEGRSEVIEIAQRASQEALNPLRNRLGENA